MIFLGRRKLNSKIKIFHVAETVRGGIATYLTLLGRSDFVDYAYVLPLSQRKDVSSLAGAVSFFNGDDRKSRMRFLVARLYGLRQQWADKNVIVHLHSTGAGLAFFFATLGIRRRCKVVYSSHGWSGLRVLPLPWRATSKLIDYLVTSKVDVVVDISEYERNYSIECLGLAQKKVRLIKNGVDIDCLKTWTSLQEGAAADNPDILKLAFVGRFDKQKGFDLLMNALSKIKRKDIKLTLIGDFVVSKDKVDINDCRVDEKGWLAHDGVIDVLRRQDYLIMPSRWEGFGLTAVEAMALGVPVIYSDRGALPEVVGDAGIKYAMEKDESADGLVQIISSLKKPSAGEIERAVERAKLFDSKVMAKEMVEIYLELAEKYQKKA